MRTTIDLPDDLFRQIKARAALRGLTLKQYVTAALRTSLYEHQGAGEVREKDAAYAEESSVLGQDCVLPRIDGETSELLRSISADRIDEILEDEESDGALPSG